MLTPEERKIIEETRRDPSTRDRAKGMSDDEILAQYRFVESGQGVKVYDSEEEWRAARRKKRQNIDEIEET